MAGFGYKTAWLSFRGMSQRDPVSLLGLQDVSEVEWPSAVASSYENHGSIVAVCPPLPGHDEDWVLATGGALFDPTPDLAALSARAGVEVQYFASHRVVEAQVWKRAVNGVLLRSFSWLGETGEILEWIGQPDDSERELGLPIDGSADDETIDAVIEAGIGERSVMAIAAAWSLDPTQLHGMPARGNPLIGRYTPL
jgi:hypothetical protein